ncbi:MAG TPA: hypothetical protein VKB26_05545 [Candidatus Acidoferrales bacterium]|nr:hypothetical protein [Candidatus Acidoferrales bacterium]
MAPSVTSTPEHVLSAPDQTAPEPSASSAPNKKRPPRTTALADAKKVLRAASAATSKSLASPRRSFSEGGPQFIHRPPDIARHRRKCAVCHHPEREVIEDLFIHWHSPNTISEYYEDDTDLTWVSIYRHAYAFGLDEVRRRNLRFAFELIIEQAADIHATPAAIIASARALGTCVSPDGQWNDPPKRVLVTNVVKHASSQLDASVSEDHRVTSSTVVKDNRDEAASYRASFPREVVGGDSAFLGAPSFAPSAKGGNSSACSAESLSGAQSLPAQAGFSSDKKFDERVSSFRASSPRDVVTSPIGSSVEADRVAQSAEETGMVGKRPSCRALHPREVVTSPAFVGADRLHRPASPPSTDSPVEQPSDHCHSERGCDEHPTRNLLFDNSAEASAAETVGAALRRPQFGSAFETETDAVAHSSYRASHPREVVTSQLNSVEPVAVRAEIKNSPNSFKLKEPPISNR